MCPAGHQPIISTINNNKLPSLISLSRDPILGVQDERKLSTMNNKALNYKRSPLRRSGKRGAANCKARIFPILLLFFACEWSVFLSEVDWFLHFLFPICFFACRASFVFLGNVPRLPFFLLLSTFCLPCSSGRYRVYIRSFCLLPRFPDLPNELFCPDER